MWLFCVAIAAFEVVSPQELSAAVADAEGPTVIRLAPGVFFGPLIVRRPVRLVGDERGTVIEGTGEGSVLSLLGDDIEVEGLIVRHSGRKNTSEDAAIKATGSRIVIRHVTTYDSLFGITLEQCKQCLVSDVVVTGEPDDATQGDGIKLWESHGSMVVDADISYVRDVVVWYSRHVTLVRNRVAHSRYGSHFMYAHDITVRDSVFSENVVGVFVMYSNRVRISDTLLAGARGSAGMGLGVKESENIALVRSKVVANTTGLYLDRAPRVPNEPVTVEESLIALNSAGLRLHSSQRGVELLRNDFINNTQPIEVDGGGDALGLVVRENHWSDYEGYDLDGDGKGDVAFEVKALSRVWTDTRPTLAFFRESVAMHALDVVAQSLPLFSSRLLVRDSAPRVRRATGVTP